MSFYILTMHKKGIIMRSQYFEAHPMPMELNSMYVHKNITDIFISLEQSMDRNLIDSREKSLAFTKLEEAHFWITKCLSDQSVKEYGMKEKDE